MGRWPRGPLVAAAAAVPDCDATAASGAPPAPRRPRPPRRALPGATGAPGAPASVPASASEEGTEASVLTGDASANTTAAGAATGAAAGTALGCCSGADTESVMAVRMGVNKTLDHASVGQAGSKTALLRAQPLHHPTAQCTTAPRTARHRRHHPSLRQSSFAKSMWPLRTRSSANSAGGRHNDRTGAVTRVRCAPLPVVAAAPGPALPPRPARRGHFAGAAQIASTQRPSRHRPRPATRCASARSERGVKVQQQRASECQRRHSAPPHQPGGGAPQRPASCRPCSA